MSGRSANQAGTRAAETPGEGAIDAAQWGDTGRGSAGGGSVTVTHPAMFKGQIFPSKKAIAQKKNMIFILLFLMTDEPLNG